MIPVKELDSEFKGKTNRKTNDVPSMEDLIEEAKTSDQDGLAASKSQAMSSHYSSNMNPGAKGSDTLNEYWNKSGFAKQNTANMRSNSGYSGINRNSEMAMVNNDESDDDSVMMRDTRDMQSEISSVMVRESGALNDKASHMSAVKEKRVVDNTRLSALTNQIMELVLDNIKMLHMNKKLLDYSKTQQIQSDAKIK